MAPLRVALIHSHYASTAPSGENVAVHLQAKALQEGGAEVALISVHTDELSHQRHYALRTAWGVATRSGADPLIDIARLRCDVVHVHNLFPNYGLSWLSQWRGPLVATLHNYRTGCANGLLSRNGRDCIDCLGKAFVWPALQHRCYRGSLAATFPLVLSQRGGMSRHPLICRADRLVVLSQRAAELFQRGGVERAKLRLIANFVERNLEAPAQSLSLPWVFVGRLTEQKGILPLLDAWPKDQPLDVIGDGDLADAVRCRQTDRIRYLGSLPREELVASLPGRRGLVFPSMSSESAASLVYLEALAAGIPTVALKGNATADDVVAYGSGLVIDGFDGLSDATARVCEAWSSYSQVAYKTYEQRFSAEAWRDAMLDLYDEVGSGQHNVNGADGGVG